MKIEYSDEFRLGTNVRRVYLYEDDGDVIMTEYPVYEDEFEIEDEDDADCDYDGPEDDNYV